MMKSKEEVKSWLACALVLACACPLFAGDVARYVDPFVGTSGTGHTTPAACVPFGLVQAGPDTGNGTWDYCSGYRYDDKTICGFTQTHLNGTGCRDLWDVRILPMAGSALRTDCGRLGEAPLPTIAFDKGSELAEPGYYAVTLDGGIKVEIAAAEHSAIYRITGNGKLRLLVDCAYGIGGKNHAKTITASDVKLIGKLGLSGKNHRRQWVERDYSFVVKFSRESAAVEELPKAEGVVAPQYVFDKFYLPKPDGLCGNDDCGQMSAWYLFSAMGFYPFNPCGGEYVIGAPQVSEARIRLGERGTGNGEWGTGNGLPAEALAKAGEREFKVIAKNLSRENKYVKSVTLNGKPVTDWRIRHADIMAGGELVFEMTAEKDGICCAWARISNNL